MKQQIITLVNQHIAQLFIEVKSILLHPDSYSQEVETEHLFDYFRFIEAALSQPYNRLAAVTAFINDTTNASQMYPIAMLREDAREAISDKSTQASNFATGLDVGGFDPESKLLCTEKHLVNI